MPKFKRPCNPLRVLQSRPIHLCGTPLIAAVLAACGGGDSSTPAPAQGAAQIVRGTAATGAALANASVTVTDSGGTNVCSEASIVTSGIGAYACTLISGKTAPFIVVVTDPSGSHLPLVSVTTVTPTAGTPLVVNASTLTTAIIGQLVGGDPLGVKASPTLINATKLDALKAKVLAQLADFLSTIGAPPGYDPFTTPIIAATSSVSGNTADQVIDLLRITTVAGVTTVATVDNPGAAVALADTSTTAATKLAAPSTTVASLADAVRLLAPALNKCFGVTSAQRALTTDTTVAANNGGPTVTATAAECQDITHPSYLNNGYSAGQAFFGLLTDPNMDGAVFSPPEIMLFLPATAPSLADRAVINVRFTDKNGVAGNVITVAQKFAGSAATSGRPTDWYVYGNQQSVDSVVRPFVRRSEQFAPNPGTAPFANAGASRYESGIDIFVNKDGPHSSGMRAARVKGPGLPPAGLVYTRPDASICTDQNWLNIRRKDGLTDTTSATAAADVGNIFRLQRTIGLTGTDATNVRPNPNASNTNTTAFISWAHPLDYGANVNATSYIDFTALKASTVYQFEIFYDGETTPRYTFNKTMLAPVIPAVNAGGLPWIALTAATLGYLDPANTLGGPVASMSLGWTANPAAETIRSAGVYSFGNGSSVNQGQIGVPRGATSAVGNAPGIAAGCAAGTAFRALTTDGSSNRTIQLRYRVLDGSYKDGTWRYNY